MEERRRRKSNNLRCGPHSPNYKHQTRNPNPEPNPSHKQVQHFNSSPPLAQRLLEAAGLVCPHAPAKQMVLPYCPVPPVALFLLLLVSLTLEPLNLHTQKPCDVAPDLETKSGVTSESFTPEHTQHTHNTHAHTNRQSFSR